MSKENLKKSILTLEDILNDVHSEFNDDIQKDAKKGFFTLSDSMDSGRQVDTLNELFFVISDISDIASSLNEDSKFSSTVTIKAKNQNNQKLLSDLLNNPEFLSSEAMSSIPDELKDEIPLNDSDKQELALISLINQTPNKQISLSNLLFAYNLVTGEVLQRRLLNNKLYRMVTQGKLYNVPGKKGVYSSIKIDGTSNEENYDDADF